jgi:hypothetical protein
MKRINTLQKIIAVTFFFGFVAVLLSPFIAVFSPYAARLAFFVGGGLALVILFLTMIQGIYNESEGDVFP